MRHLTSAWRRHAAATVLLAAMAAACAGGPHAAGDSRAFAAPDLSHINGQAATCGEPREKTFSLEVREATLDLGLGFHFNAWRRAGQCR